MDELNVSALGALSAAYEREGFATIGLLPPSEVAGLVGAADRLQRQAGALRSSDSHFNLEGPAGGFGTQHGKAPVHAGVPRKVSDVVSLAEEFATVASSTVVLDACAVLLRRDPLLTHSILWCKPPRIGSAKPPHQDAPYLEGSPDEFVTVWLALDRATTENGCLEFVAQSQDEGLVRHQGAELRVPDSLFLTDRTRAVELEPGEAVFFHPLTLHRSAPNESGEPRRALMLRYRGRAG